MEYLISLNICIGNELINPSHMPILYYQNNTDNILENMCKDDKFFDYFSTYCLNPENYHKIELSYFTYNIKTEEYVNYFVNLQDIYIMPNELSIRYILNVFEELFNIVFKEKYNNKEDDTYVDSIVSIYNTLKNKFKERISKTTLSQYLRSKLQDILNSNNINIAIRLFEDIIE